MKTAVRILMCLIGGALFAVGLYQLTFINVDFGTVCAPLLGGLLLLYGIFFDFVNNHTRSKPLKILRYAVIFGICSTICFSGFLFSYGGRDNVSYDEDALIVLGAGVHGDQISLALKYRLDAALEYSRQNPDALIIVTGGRGFQEDVTEAYAMEKYLLENGADPSSIIKEENASSTTENFKFSKEMLDERFGENNYRAAVVTSDFHVFRAVRIAAKCGLDVTHIHAKTPLNTIVSSYIREAAAVAKLVILGY